MSKNRKNRNGLTKPKRPYDQIPFEVPNVFTRGLFGADGPAETRPYYVQQVLLDKPEAYWMLDEQAGATTLTDVTGNGHTATIPPNPAYTFGVGGGPGKHRGLLLDPNHLASTFTGIVVGTTATWEFWAKPRYDIGAHYNLVFGSGAGGVGFYFAADLGKFLVFTGSDQVHNTQLVNGALVHVVVSISAGAGSWYINGQPDGTFSGWGGNTFGNLFNGNSPVVFNFDLIDDFAYYTYALTAKQAFDHYKLGSVPTA